MTDIHEDGSLADMLAAIRSFVVSLKQKLKEVMTTVVVMVLSLWLLQAQVLLSLHLATTYRKDIHKQICLIGAPYKLTTTWLHRPTGNR